MSDNNTPQIKYDVFVSFRGDDTRPGFLSQLTNIFQRNKINAFVDDKLEKGDEIWPSLVEAIHGSFISLIIFSQNYASSRWCLEELVTILECKEKYGQIVIPVFYDVEPTNVRYQTGNYETAFSKHEKKYSRDKVEKWREALNTSANISGFEPSCFRSEVKLLEEIVIHVLRMVNKPVVNSKVLFGIEEKIVGVESLIHKESKVTRLIGIWGGGGIGKTTLAEEIFNKLRSKYEGCYFLANEREQSLRRGIDSLQEEIFSELLANVAKIEESNSLPNGIDRRIGRMKVLIVLDDVNDSDHLEKLLGSRDNFGPGSRIIVTTRDKQVLSANKANETYELKQLSLNEALELFNFYAFNQIDHQREYDEPLKGIVEYAQGNPLVVKVLARFLCGKDMEVWRSQLDKLKRMPRPDVYKVMKLSYDDLDRQEQQIFLDLGCFFIGLHVKVNVGYLKSLLENGESGNSVVVGLERLKDKALITFSEDNFVSMHDTSQEMAWEIVRQQCSEHPRSCSRLWAAEDIYEAFKNEEGIEAVRSIRIHLSSSKQQKLNPRIFEKMKELKFLEISRNGNQDCHDQLICAVDGLQFLRTELRFLYCHYYPKKSLPENFSAEKLVILRLPNSEIENLWYEVKNLVNLKEIDLTDSKKLKELPDLSKATNLEVLLLGSCSSLTSVHPSIFSLEKLEKVDLQKCKSLAKFESKSDSCNFSYLKLDSCEDLVKFSVILKKLKELGLRGTKVKEFTSSFEHLSELRLLYLDGSVIEKLPPYMKKFTHLTHIEVSRCLKLKTIPELPLSLEILDAKHCTSLQTLPKLPSSLKILNVGYCKSLLTLPELPHLLETLNTESCTLLKTLPELPSSLRTLYAEGCSNLHILPHLPRDLQKLFVHYCTSLQTLPELPPFLRTLKARNCASLKTVLLPSIAVEQLKDSRKMVLFWNCLNLDEFSLATIQLNAGKNVIKCATQHLSAPNHQVENFNNYDRKYHSYQVLYVYPGNTVPEWFEYKTRMNSIIIDLSSAPLSAPLGFIFCFVLGPYGTAKLERIEANITISDDKGESEMDSVKILIDHWLVEIKSDHVCVMYDRRCSAFLNSRVKNQGRFKIEVAMMILLESKEIRSLPRHMLKGFGVSPVSTSAYNSFIQKYGNA